MSEQINTIEDLLNVIESKHPLDSQRDRGTLFERAVLVYLQNEPMYQRLYESVWLLNEVPLEYNIPQRDTGVDLVAKRRDTGNLVAIQAKYYNLNTKIYKRDIDSFLNEVGKSFYSEGMIVATTNDWSKDAEDALINRDKLINRIGFTDLMDSQIEWGTYAPQEQRKINLKRKKVPRSHQLDAINATLQGFQEKSRGKLIMAPGTGKTYTSLQIAENLAAKKDTVYTVLYLVPSIQLLSQSLRGWMGDTIYSMDALAVCSDRNVTRKTKDEDDSDISISDIGYPATTKTEQLLAYQKRIEKSPNKGEMLVVFSTYQSIDVISRAQKEGFYEFDLIICDEAHRTTGSTEKGKEGSAFVQVHNNDRVKGLKRLYQTATPRVYGEGIKAKAEEMSVLIADMEDESIYGPEFYRLGFGEAVHRDILTDYKVMVLAVDEVMVQSHMQRVFSNRDNELEFDDVTKIIGCWNGLIKRKNGSNELYGPPMKRAIAFTNTIKNSKTITNMWDTVVNEYIDYDGEYAFNVEIDHADGSMNALQKNEKINWLKSDVPDGTCRILSNARFLTEGVDVPELDSVIFLNPRKSKIDIAQAVGRVMRYSPNKEYGYVILPIGVPSGKSANDVLDNTERYKVVWDVLNALRSIDERFDATINKLDLNKSKPKQVSIIGIEGGAPDTDENGNLKIEEPAQLELDLSDEEWTNLEKAIYGKIVEKVGNTRYWESWSKDVTQIAQQHIIRINTMIDVDTKTEYAFNKFLKGLRHNINDSITKSEAVEMVAQHLITKPVFDALFEEESFALNNPISQSMDKIIQVLEELGFDKEQEKLKGFYESVHIRADGIDNLEAKQTIIVQLYEKFFKVGFPNTTDRLGIVFTPVEVVDFILHSVEGVLNKHLGKSLNDHNVNVLDPFTGTGTFITRLLQSGIIEQKKLLYKYMNEIYANEIILLSYYIAAINIEETFKHVYKNKDYIPFEGIVLTDTFETKHEENTLDNDLFGDNNERIQKQKNSPITVIIGNPPYSIGQTNANDNNQNTEHTDLNERINATYVQHTTVNNNRPLFDSYVKALRWSSDRLTNSGVIGYVIPNSLIDKSTFEGVRKTLHDDFNQIYIINLKGSVRGKIGDSAKREGESIFNILTGICILVLVKDSSSNKNEIKYIEVPDYSTKKQKLDFLSKMNSVVDCEDQFTNIEPDDKNDWINQTNKEYDSFYELDKDVFYTKAIGVTTNRDSWVYGFSKEKVVENTETMIDNYNLEVDKLEKYGAAERIKRMDTDSTKIKWSRGLKNKLQRSIKLGKSQNIVLTMYRPFTKKWLYYDKDVVEYPGIYHNIFGNNNKVIFVTGSGARREFSTVLTDKIPDLSLVESGRGYTLYNNEPQSLEIKNNSNINEQFLNEIGLNNEDTFYYVYGILNSNDYRKRYSTDLNKSLPRIPIVKNKKVYIEAGKKLAELHLNYENIEPYSDLEIEIKKNEPSYHVEKIKFGRGKDKSIIIFNKDITIKNIPKKAYQYVINGRSAIEWIIDQYRIKIDGKSGIIDDPNEYSDNPQYIFNLLLSIINVSVQTVDLINSLPELERIK